MEYLVAVSVLASTCTCGLRTDGTIQCWAANGHIGGSSPFRNVPYCRDQRQERMRSPNQRNRLMPGNPAHPTTRRSPLGEPRLARPYHEGLLAQAGDRHLPQTPRNPARPARAARGLERPRVGGGNPPVEGLSRV